MSREKYEEREEEPFHRWIIVAAKKVSRPAEEVHDLVLCPVAVVHRPLLADEAALLNAKAAIQVHGGMGFTWEVPLHLYLKRAWLLATIFGTADEHALALAAAV